MKKVTLQEIANSLGISRTTVWKVFSGHEGVSDSLGFGDDLGAQGIGDTFVSAEHLPDGGPGDAQGICNFL